MNVAVDHSDEGNMLTDRRRVIRRAALTTMVILACGLVQAGAPRQAVPHGGGGGGGGSMHARAAVPAYGGGRAATAVPRGQVPAGGTANGVARWGYGYPYYGYGYGYGYGGYWGYPWYDGWGPYWGAGWYAGWGWPYYYGGWPYGVWYGAPYDPAYVATLPPIDPKTPATVVTKMTPSKAEIAVDGVPVGYVKDYNGRWDDLDLPPGRHAITISSAGYVTQVIDLEAGPGGHYVLSDDLVRGDGESRRTIAPPAPPAVATSTSDARAAAPPAPSIASGRLKVRVQPEDAAVYIDGEYLGVGGELARLHGAIPVATGPHRLEVVRPGYASAVSTIDVTGDAVAEATITLVAAP